MAIITAWLATGPRAHAGRIPCDDVIAMIIHEVGVERGKSTDMSKVAKALHTDPAWVEHCMEAAGRRPKRPGYESAEGREQRLEKFESDEPEETFAEDKEEPGAVERREHPERERQGHIRIAPPTPDYYHDTSRD